MAREVWPKAAVIAASQDVICLAVYRWRTGDAPASEPARKPAVSDSEWAARLDVKAYPQIRLLDGFGRTLPSSAAHELDRRPEQVVAAMAAANAGGKAAQPPAPRKLPAGLLSRLPGKDRAAALDPIGSVRCRAWLSALEEGEWSAGDLVALFGADDDPVLRLRLIERLGAMRLDEAAIDALAEAVLGDNDYVRGAALKLLGRTGGERAVSALRDTIGKAVEGGTGWKNPNNVLIEALDASIATADRTLVDVLGRVLVRHGANNYATVLATKSLVAIGRKSGAELVRPHLERAAQLEGGQAAQIRREVDAFLGGK
jgi:hypothetical protein